MSQGMEEWDIPEWTLGWRLQRALGFADVSVEAMAEELDVSRSTISRWCHDIGAPPRSIYLRAWAAKCRVPADWLILGELPRVDSNHQPDDSLHDDEGHLHPNGRALIGRMAKQLTPEDEALIRRAIPIRPHVLSP